MDLVTQATAANLARPIPCADWTLHGLLRHMATQHYGFAAASGGDGDLARWRMRALGEDPAAAYRAAAEAGDQLPLRRLRGAFLGRRQDTGPASELRPRTARRGTQRGAART